MTTSSAGLQADGQVGGLQHVRPPSKNMPRQPQHDLRHVGAQQQRGQQRHQPGQDRHGGALDRQLGHARSTNNTVPIGGCSSPIIRLSTITSPKCTRSMPSFWQIGIRIGTSSVIAAVGSRKQPTNSISRLASSRNIAGLLVKASTQAAIVVGDARHRQQPAEDRGRGDDEQHRGGGLDGVHRDLDQHPPVERAVPDQAEEQRPDRGGDRAFGRGEDAERHAADQQHRRHHARGTPRRRSCPARARRTPRRPGTCACARSRRR